MTPDFLTRVRELSTIPTAEHPFGQRHAVLERAAIMHFDGGLPLAEADAKAWDLVVGGGQLRIGGVE